MNRETIGNYELEIIDLHDGKWVYSIFKPGSKTEAIVNSSEWFDCAGRARLAAIGHISLLEKGE